MRTQMVGGDRWMISNKRCATPKSIKQTTRSIQIVKLAKATDVRRKHKNAFALSENDSLKKAGTRGG